MKTLERLRLDRDKNAVAIERLLDKQKMLDKEIERLNMLEIYEETKRLGANDAGELRKMIVEARKENERIIREGGAINA